MSFQMTHMEVAYNLINHLKIKEGREEFILGSVAPDSVHFRDPFKIEDKVHSHLFEGCGVWSDTQDYDRWMTNINEFWDKYGEDEMDVRRRMFILGICVHCVTDFYNDLLIWRSLQNEYLPAMTLEDFRSEYYPEAQKVDKWLFQNSRNSEEIVKLLLAAKETDLEDYIHAEDTAAMKKHLVDTQYNLPETVDVSGYKYYPSDKILWFVETVSDRIHGMILNHRFEDKETVKNTLQN